MSEEGDMVATTKKGQRVDDNGEVIDVQSPEGLSLVGKLSWVMGQVGRIPKRGRNEHFNYDYVREGDLVAAVTALLANVRVFLHSQIVRIEHVRDVETQRGGKQEHVRVWVHFVWLDGDSDARLGYEPWPGDGMDNADKAVSKALTAAEKTFLMKQFLVASGDDPDEMRQGEGPPARRQRSGSTDSGSGSAPKKASDAQRKMVEKLAADLGLDRDALHRRAGVASMTELTMRGASTLIEEFAAEKKSRGPAAGDGATTSTGKGTEDAPEPPQEPVGAGEPVATSPNGSGPATDEQWKRLRFLCNDNEERMKSEFASVLGREWGVGEQPSVAELDKVIASVSGTSS